MEQKTSIELLEELISKDKLKEAVELLNKHNKELFLKDPIYTINQHLYALLELARYDECYKVLDNYKSYPYQNIEVEEHLMLLSDELGNMISNAIQEKSKERNVDENGVDFSKFHSNSEAKLDEFIMQIYHSRVHYEYENEIENILKRNKSDNLNFKCLCMLYDINSSKLVDFQYKNSSYSVRLNAIHFPFSVEDTEYHAIKNDINNTMKDVTIAETAVSLLGALRVYIFPDFFKKEDAEYISIAAINTAKKLFGQPIILLENDRVKFFMNLLEKISNS